MAITPKDIDRLIREHGLGACLECGKCTAICPMSEVFGDIEYGHTPRGIVEKALFDSDLITGDAIWYCLTCEVCTKGCPSGVRFRDFMEELREMMIAAGHDEHGVRCRLCNRYFVPEPSLKMMIAKMDVKDSTPEFLLTCPKCKTRDFGRKLMKNFAPGRSEK